jgi:3-hydroxyisobutyrate dehydrogenase
MGSPMARHVARSGYDVRAWDINLENLATVAAAGVITCATANEATAGADVVITMLTDYAVVYEVMAGAQDALDGFSGLWIQSTTVGLDGTRELAALAVQAGVTFVDAPVLGTKPAAEAGALIVLGSGPSDVERQCRAIFDAFSARVLWLGPAGAGSRLKLIMNGWIIGLTTLTAETLALCVGLGIAPSTFYEMIDGGPHDLPQLHVKGDAMLAREFLPPTLPLRLAAKDARLIVAAGNEAGITLLLADAVAQQLERALNAGHGDEDYGAVWYSVEPRLSGR